MYYLNLDENGYLLSISTVGSGISIESLDGLDLAGNHINAYRWDGENLVAEPIEIQLSDIPELVTLLGQ